MNALSISKYNQMQTLKWRSDYEKAKIEGRHYSIMPQLAMYIFEKSYGYVAFCDRVAIWSKTKKDALNKLKTYLS